MAKDTSDDLIYWLEIKKEHKDYLNQIRHWNYLKVGSDENYYWVKDMSWNQIQSIEIKSIPFKTIYYNKENKLFKEGSILPYKKTPTSLLWTPIEKALPVSLPGLNHNYFGIKERLKIKLIPTDEEHTSVGLLTSMECLGSFMNTAPAIRLKNLSWILVGSDKAMIIGTPLLPLPGITYWQRKSSLLPSGYNFEFNFLTNMVEKKINRDVQELLIWYTDNTFTKIKKELIRPLSISSFRLTSRYR